MLKFLLIVAVITYVLYKLGSFLFKVGAASQQFRNNQAPGNINGNDRRAKTGKKPKISGDYIDYEEVK